MIHGIVTNLHTRKGIFLLIALFVAVSLSHGQTDTSLPPTEEGPVKVEVGVFILDVDKINSADQTYSANVYYAARWHDPRLTHDKSESVTYKLEEVWHPRLQIVNQQRMIKTMPEVVEVSPEGIAFYRQRLWGHLAQRLNLRDFPFDTQTFHVNITTASFQPDQVEMIPIEQKIIGVASELSIADWKIISWNAETVPFQFAPSSPRTAVFEFSFTARREYWYFITMVIVPLVLIVAMSWLTFWINPQDTGPQISMAVTAMLSLIAYRFAIGSTLPKLSYMTRMDLFIFFSTFLVFATLIEAVTVSSKAKSGRLEAALKIDRFARIVFPIGMVVALIVSFVI